MCESMQSEDYYILLKAMKIEVYGQKFFSILAKLAKDDESKKLFKRLSAEERMNYLLLKKAVGRRKKPKDYDIDFSPSCLFNKDLKCLLKEGPVTAFKYALELEQCVADYYYSNLKHIGDRKTRKLILELIESKESHKKTLGDHLSRLLDTLLKEINKLPSNRGAMSHR